MLGVTEAFLLFVFFGLIRTYRSGLRRVSITNQQITLVFPDDQVQLDPALITELSIKRRKKEGKVKGNVRFVDQFGERRSWSFRMNKRDGVEGFAYFQYLEQQNK